MKSATLAQIQADRAAKRAVVLATNLATGAERLIYPNALDGLEPLLAAAVGNAARNDQSGNVDTPEGKLFLHVFNPPLRLVVVGAVHIAQPLARMAALAGYDVTIIDPRSAFATNERFPGVTISTEWPDEALAKLKPDARTAVVTLTHDPKIDDPALEATLRSPAFYVGSLGSRKTHNARLYRLHKAGFTETETARIHGPVGLGIGAKSPAEIAVAILAQITERLRQPKS
ncbi:MAG: xanthine dehydrogenase [Alphaproteobacteria bacterium]|nr:xanthine dehydrogenase [Alphaproteobacteria bacterium]